MCTRVKLCVFRIEDPCVGAKAGCKDIVVYVGAWGLTVQGLRKCWAYFRFRVKCFVRKFLGCSSCMLSSRLRLGRAPKFILPLDPEMPQTHRDFVTAFATSFIVSTLHFWVTIIYFVKFMCKHFVMFRWFLMGDLITSLDFDRF